MKLPNEYTWLSKEGAPRMLTEALKLYGVREVVGSGDNKEILGWAKEIGLAFSHDETPWCGLYAAVVAKRAGKEPPKEPLWALNWRNFGKVATTPMLGDVMVFSRNGGGHVALLVGEDAACWHSQSARQSRRHEGLQQKFCVITCSSSNNDNWMGQSNKCSSYRIRKYSQQCQCDIYDRASGWLRYGYVRELFY
jgi:uncharacterized protein (TIGR02594 family)